MVNLQTTALLVNNKKASLSWDGDIFQKLQDIQFHRGSEEFIEASVDGNDYFRGWENSYFTAIVLLTSDITSIINADSNDDANGEFQEKTGIVSVTDRSGTAKTYTITAYIRDYDLLKAAKGAMKLQIFFRITQEEPTVT